MLFNGLLMCADSDTSDFAKDSIGAHSAAESSASESTRARCLENKLLATMQILKNKEETVRVQAESLALAEARIAMLTHKIKQSSHKMHQAEQTNPFATRSSADGCRVEMTDVSAAADLQMDQKIVNSLRDNLSVVEELYRDCFYETAKQEELITKLRKAYLDVRSLERQKSEQIGHLQRLVGSQRCSSGRCQDVASEVENLRSEITNFLNTTQNDDSGVWEREERAGDAADDLRAIRDQLHRLRHLLNTECTCGMEEDNLKLKRNNEIMEIQIGELRQRIDQLEEVLEDKENMNTQYRSHIEQKEQELQCARRQLTALQEELRDRAAACCALTGRLQRAEECADDRATQLSCVRRVCESHERALKELRDELDRANLVASENGRVRDEVSRLAAQVSRWRAQLSDSRGRLRALQDELRRARDQCRHLAAHYRERAGAADALQTALEEAQRRGAALCGEARRAVDAVRRWLLKQRQKNRERDDKMKEQELLIRALRQERCASERTSASENEPCRSERSSDAGARRSSRTCAGASEIEIFPKCPSSRRTDLHSSGSETASGPPPPAPPRRLLRKKPFCEDKRCQWPATVEAAVQRPRRRVAAVSARLSHDDSRTRLSDVAPRSPGPDSLQRELSPTDELLDRIERTHDALTDAQRRWSGRSAALGPRSPEP